jgi:DNA-binding MarR family transcriptional regulator
VNEPAARPDGGDDFGVLLSLAYVTFVRELDVALAAAGYAGFQRWYGYVLRALAAEPVTLRELADRLEVTSPAALKTVRAMEADGYLERQPDPRDGRVRRVALTARGRDALTAARAFHTRFERELAEQAGAVRVRHTRVALAAVVDRGGRDVPRLFRPL